MTLLIWTAMDRPDSNEKFGEFLRVGSSHGGRCDRADPTVVCIQGFGFVGSAMVTAAASTTRGGSVLRSGIFQPCGRESCGREFYRGHSPGSGRKTVRRTLGSMMGRATSDSRQGFLRSSGSCRAGDNCASGLAGPTRRWRNSRYHRAAVTPTVSHGPASLKFMSCTITP